MLCRISDIMDDLGDMNAADRRARCRWAQFMRGPIARGGLVRVHTGNKFLLLAHSTRFYRSLGRIVAAPKCVPIAEMVAQYQREFDLALAQPPTVGSHTNVLQHLAGYFKRTLPRTERAAIASVIEAYYRGELPLTRPLAHIREHAIRLRIDYLLTQTYLGAT